MHHSSPVGRTVLSLLLSSLAAGCGGTDSTGPGDGNGNGGGNGGPTIATVQVSPSTLELDVGETEGLTATARTATGQTVTTSFTWSTRGEGIATVSTSGLVLAVGPGSTLIDASAGGVTGSAAITVAAAAPDAPSDLVAIAGGPDVVSLSWTDNSDGETGFEVERSLQEGSGFSAIGTTETNVTAFDDEGLEPETTYYYRVHALGEGDPSDFSNVAQVTTTAPVDPSSPFECEREGYPCTWTEVDPTIFDQSDAFGDQILQMFDEGQTVAEAVAWIQSQPNVVEAVANGVALRFRLMGGRPTWVFGPDAILIGDPDGAPPPRPRVPPSRTVVGDEPKTKRALVLSVYQYEFGQWDEGAELAALLEGARGYQGNVVYLANTASEQQVSPADFKGWGNYDVIHVSTHGVQMCEGEACKTVILAGKEIASGEVILGSTDRGVDLAKIEYGGRSYGLSTDFFKEEYPGGLPNTIVFMSACQTSKGDDLAEALTAGGGAYLGWTETVWSSSAKKAALAFFQNLVDKGVPSTAAFLSLREGDDLTIDRPNSSGSIATLDISTSGDDLRIREVVYPRNPLSEQDLPSEAPYPIVGQPGDGQPDKIPYLIKVDGVEGEPAGFTVHVEINGFSGEPVSLAEGEAVGGDGNVWQVKGEVPVTFDAEQGQEVHVRAWVDLPEGGVSEWDEDPRLGNPALRFTSTMETVGNPAPVVRVFSRVEAEFDLSLDDEFEKLTGNDELRYLEYVLDVTAPCSASTTKQNGTLQVIDGDFTWTEGGPTAPERLVIFIPPTISETYTVTCPEGTGTIQTIHYFAGFVSYHGGGFCGSENELDEDAGGLVIQGWEAGSGDVMARKVYQRTCTQGDITITEDTTLELIDPTETGGG